VALVLLAEHVLHSENTHAASRANFYRNRKPFKTVQCFRAADITRCVTCEVWYHSWIILIPPLRST
jgi:hypothetical protein